MNLLRWARGIPILLYLLVVALSQIDLLFDRRIDVDVDVGQGQPEAAPVHVPLNTEFLVVLTYE